MPSASSAAALLFATPIEAAPLLAAIDHTPLACDHGSLFAAGGVLIALSGMGLAPARAMVACLAERWSVPLVVNAGVAGSLSRALAIGDVVQVSNARGDGGEAGGIELSGPSFVAHEALRRARLLSRDEPLFDPVLRARYARSADVVDMEGYAVADECTRRGIGCLMFKTVSDHASDRATLLANLDRSSRRMAAFVLAHLNDFKSRSTPP